MAKACVSGHQPHRRRQRVDRPHQRAGAARQRATEPEGQHVERWSLMPTIAADSRDWLTAFSASPQAVRLMNQTAPISIAMPAPPANTRSQVITTIARRHDARPERRRAQRIRAEDDQRSVAQEDRDAEGDQDAVVALAFGGGAVERRQQASARSATDSANDSAIATRTAGSGGMPSQAMAKYAK